jgi:L-threonylcarbamoyladenylate synthase
MKYKHYAPQARLEIVSGSDETVVRFLRQAIAQDPRVGILGPSELLDALQGGIRFDLGSRKHPDDMAHQLFSALRSLDDQRLTHAYFIALSEVGVGKAIMNRVNKAANHRMITLDDPSKEIP